jgi:hypothetical protein
LLRDFDRTVVAGDAFTTTKQESLIAALTQRAEIHGPPMYFTPDWDKARSSVKHLAEYAPSAAITGHGPPLRGERLQDGLQKLSAHFDIWARPSRGRYRDHPAITDASGVVDVPPPQVSARTMAIAGVALGAAIAFALAKRRNDATPVEGLADVAPSMPDDVSIAQMPEGNADESDLTVSQRAQQLDDSPSQVDASSGW